MSKEFIHVNKVLIVRISALLFLCELRTSFSFPLLHERNRKQSSIRRKSAFEMADCMSRRCRLAYLLWRSRLFMYCAALNTCGTVALLQPTLFAFSRAKKDRICSTIDLTTI